jgi:hypothetical protein
VHGDRAALGGDHRFLRVEQPAGAPSTGFSPLLALLRRQLSEDEIADLATQLARNGVTTLSVIDLGVAITAVEDDLPSQRDIRAGRVVSSLTDGRFGRSPYRCPRRHLGIRAVFRRRDDKWAGGLRWLVELGCAQAAQRRWGSDLDQVAPLSWCKRY